MSDSILNKLRARIESGLDRSGKARTFSFEWGLEKIAALYGAAVSCRILLHEKEMIRSKELPCFVVSIGNVVAGGAGKTPMSIYLAELFLKLGKKTVVVSRGYKGSYREESLVVSDGNQIFYSPDVCGDEPYMMAMKKKFPVVVGRNRASAGRRAIEAFNPDVIILDDGFQHLKLKRDLDLVLIDCRRPFGNEKLLPAGRLREPVGNAAKRAGAVIFTRCEKQEVSEQDKALAVFDRLPAFKTSHEAFVLNPHAQAGDSLEKFDGSERIKGKRVLLFSGVADNRSVCRTVERFGVNIVEHLEFQDHYRYKSADFEAINRTALQKNVDLIMTTEKDWIKTGSFKEWSVKVLVAGIRIRFEHPDRFQKYMEEQISEK